MFRFRPDGLGVAAAAQWHILVGTPDAQSRRDVIQRESGPSQYAEFDRIAANSILQRRRRHPAAPTA